jgi:hypothetical protein
VAVLAGGGVTIEAIQTVMSYGGRKLDYLQVYVTLLFEKLQTLERLEIGYLNLQQ